MSRKSDAIDVIPKYLVMIDSDLMKVAHYLKEGVKVAIVAENRELSVKLAALHVQADELSREFKLLVDPELGEDSNEQN